MCYVMKYMEFKGIPPFVSRVWSSVYCISVSLTLWKNMLLTAGVDGFQLGGLSSKFLFHSSQSTLKTGEEIK